MTALALGPEDIAAVMDELTALLARASLAILQKRNAPSRPKADGSPVTDADEAAEEVILQGLGRLLPGIPVISEESVGRQQPPAPGANFILVDPLDGTREFVAGRDEYTINLAVLAQGEPIAGLIAAPARNLLWRGIIGRGAERLKLQGERALDPERIATRRCPKTGVVALVSRSHRDAATDAFLARMPDADVEVCGSSLKFCRLAEGAADIYPRLGPTSEWDIAAGHALVAAAGGAMRDLQGRPLAYGRADKSFRVPGFIACGDPQQVRSI